MENKDIKKINFFENYSYLDHNSIVIDLGANIGDVTNFIYNKYKCYLYAYEPNRACFNFMKERFLGNDKILYIIMQYLILLEIVSYIFIMMLKEIMIRVISLAQQC